MRRGSTSTRIVDRIGAPTATPRAHPATERGRRTRAAIVDSAAELVYLHGVSGTSLDDVLSRSGAGKSQLYHYFENKKDLIRAVIDRQLERVLGAQPRLRTITSWTDFEAWAHELQALHEGPSGPLACPVGTLAAEIDRDEDLRPVAAAAFHSWADPLRDAILALQARDEIASDEDPQRLALRVLATIQGGMLIANTLQDVSVLADAIERLLAELRPPRAPATPADPASDERLGHLR